MAPALTRRRFLRLAGGTLVAGPLLSVSGCTDEAPRGASDRMNVIVVILDTLRKDHVGVYGDALASTPSIDALAQQSLRFERAFPEALPSIPVRRAVHTGQRTFPARDWNPQKGYLAPIYGWQKIPEDQVALAEILKPAGYTTAIVTDAYHEFRPTMNFHRGMDHFEWIRGQEADTWRSPETANEERLAQHMPYYAVDHPLANRIRQHIANTDDDRSEEDYFAPTVFRTAGDWLEQEAVEPFFLVVDSYDPHEPWDPPQRYVEQYSDEFPSWSDPEPITPIYGSRRYIDDRHLDRMRALYAAEVTMTDRWLGRFLERLDDRGVLDRTAVVFLSDHGISLGEHGFTGKLPWALWPELMDIPMLVRHPEGRGAGRTTSYFTSTHDLAPTILGLTGVAPAQPMQGHDLSPLLDGGEPPPRLHLSAMFNEYVWCRTDRHVLICRNDGEEQSLYRPEQDPAQERDIAAAEPEVADELFELIVADAGGEPLPTYDLEALGRRSLDALGEDRSAADDVVEQGGR